MRYSKSNLVLLETLTNQMNKLGVASHADLIGVPDSEITQFEQMQGHSLPEFYRLFLATCGRSAGFLSPWLAFYFDDLSEIKQHFQAVTARNPHSPNLPSDILLIANFENVFDGINLSETNPKVTRWDFNTQSRGICSTVANDFAEYLSSLIQNSDSLRVPEDFISDEEAELSEDIINF